MTSINNILLCPFCEPHLTFSSWLRRVIGNRYLIHKHELNGRHLSNRNVYQRFCAKCSHNASLDLAKLNPIFFHFYYTVHYCTSDWLDDSAHDRKIWLQSLGVHRPIMIHFKSSALFQRLHVQTETSSLPKKLSTYSNTLDIYQKFSYWGFKDESQQHNGLPQISLTSLDNREDCNRILACSGSYTNCLKLWHDRSSF